MCTQSCRDCPKSPGHYFGGAWSCGPATHFFPFPWPWSLVSLGAQGSLQAWSPKPWVWWRPRFPLTAPWPRAAWYFSRSPREGSAVFLVCTYNFCPTAIFFPCCVLNIRASLTHWVSVCVTILCLHMSLHLVPWCFSSNSSFLACIWDQHYFTSSFWPLVLSSQQLFQCGTLWEQLLIPIQEPPFSLSGFREAAGVLQLLAFCLLVLTDGHQAPGGSQRSGVLLTWSYLPGRFFCSPCQPWENRKKKSF